MKQWIYIMIVYFLGLAMQPCADTDFFVSVLKATPSEQQLDYHHNEEHHQPHSSNKAHECNPLCICTCCGIQVLPNIAVVELLQPKTMLRQELFIRRNDQILAKYINDIWQPPKISLTF